MTLFKLSQYSAFVICISFLALTECQPGQKDLSRFSDKIDSLLTIEELNDRTILIKFGYDAVNAIKTAKGIVVVDAGISTGLTRKYRKIIEDEFGQKNFIFMINTHGHQDHTRGNGVFGEAKIVGHDNCLNEIRAQWKDPEKVKENLERIVEENDSLLKRSVTGTAEWTYNFTQKIRYLSAHYDVKNSVQSKLPDTTFSDSLKIDSGDTTFELFYFGNCHSTSDILIYVPELKMIFTGDLFSKYGSVNRDGKLIPDTSRWRQSAHWIESRMDNIEIVVDGHGEILTKDDLAQFTINILNK